MSHFNSVDLIAQLVNDLIEARESIAGWADYASDYFKKKHDLVGELNDFSKKIDLAKDRLKQLKQMRSNALRQGDFLSVEDLEKAWNDQAESIHDWNTLGLDEQIFWAQSQLQARRGMQPIPISERQPSPDDCNEDGECWLLGKVNTEWRLLNPQRTGLTALKYAFSYWLPYAAIPIVNE